MGTCFIFFSSTSSTGAHGIESLQTEFISSFDALIILNFHLFHGIVGVDFFVLKLMVQALDDLLIWNELLKEACVTNLAHHTRILRELKYEAEKQKIRIPIRPLLLKIQMGCLKTRRKNK